MKCLLLAARARGLFGADAARAVTLAAGRGNGANRSRHGGFDVVGFAEGWAGVLELAVPKMDAVVLFD